MRAFALAAAVVVLVGCATSATLYIEAFDAHLTLSPDGDLRVVETLTVVYLSPYHGIDRLVPVSYRTPLDTRITIDLRLVSVSMDGGSVPVSSRASDGNWVFRIGDPDVTITGTHVYRIEYAASRVLLFRDDDLQLYWNVTGNDWDLPIRSVTATLTLPADVSPELVTATSYVGTWGTAATGSPVTRDAAGRLVFSAGTLDPGSGLTIDVSIPRSAMPLHPPSFAANLGRFVWDNKLVLLPLVALGLLFALWAPKVVF